MQVQQQHGVDELLDEEDAFAAEGKQRFGGWRKQKSVRFRKKGTLNEAVMLL
jgi:hypothetical protein